MEKYKIKNVFQTEMTVIYSYFLFTKKQSSIDGITLFLLRMLSG